MTYATTVNNNIADASLTTPSGTVVGQETDRGAYVLAIDGGPTIERAFTGQGVAATPPQGDFVGTLRAQYQRPQPDGTTQVVRFVFHTTMVQGEPVGQVEQFTCTR